MRVTLRIAIEILVTCTAGSVLLGAMPRSAADRNSATNSAAAPHVQSALKAELAGDGTERDQQLADALEVDPNYAPARWQSGQVRIGDDWLSIEDSAARFAEDARLREYRQRRAELVDTAEAQRELARWCTRNRLSDEAAVHWQAVRTFLPNDAEAIRALRLKMHNGRLLNPRELAEAREQAGRESEAARKWRPKLMEWRDALLKGDPLERQAAVEGLQSIRDPAAIPVLRAVFGDATRGPRAGDLYGVFIDILAQMPEEEATRELVHQVLAGDSLLAASALKGRPLSSYVPQLIAALPTDVKISGNTDIFYTDNGFTYRIHELTVQIPEMNYSATQVAQFSHAHVAAPNRSGRFDPSQTTPQIQAGMARDFQQSVHEAQAFERQVQVEQRRLEETVGRKRERIERALLASTDFEVSKTREDWLSQLNRALETYTPVRIPEIGPRSERHVYQSLAYSVYRPSSCFAEGTPVETLTGPAAIETLKPGDRVLSQDAETGELAYQAVREVTLRPAAPLVEIEAGGETIRATRGHPFWVNGEGWIMAKQLQAGQQLHTPDGPLTIDRIGQQPAQEAYNLVVSDFATYFVGDHKILVHDNQPLTGTGMLVPGLAARDLGTP